MFGPHFPGMPKMTIPVTKSDVKIAKRMASGSLMFTEFRGFDLDLRSSINNIFDGDRDIDHAIIETYIEEEDWDEGHEWGYC